MNQNEQNFAELKKLLKFKQHEVPPPGYFNNFSGLVISRIRAGEGSRAQTRTERLQSNAPWAVSFLRIFETRHGLIGAFATGFCLLLVLVAVSGQRSEVASQNLLTVSEPSVAMGSSAAALAAPALVAAADSTGIVASTNPVTSLQPVATLFGQPASATLFQPASFAPVNH